MFFGYGNAVARAATQSSAFLSTILECPMGRNVLFTMSCAPLNCRVVRVEIALLTFIRYIMKFQIGRRYHLLCFGERCKKRNTKKKMKNKKNFSLECRMRLKLAASALKLRYGSTTIFSWISVLILFPMELLFQYTILRHS